MSKSTLIRTLQQACHIARASIKTGISPAELLGMFREKVSRRRLLQGSLALASTVTTASFFRNGHLSAKAAGTPILIVGAGIAGLTAAYRLKQYGIAVDIIEARMAVGGRIRTFPKAAGTLNLAELGGEYINTSHTCIRTLAAELGLQEVDLVATQQGLIQDTYYFQGRRISLEEILNDFVPLAAQIDKDLSTIGNQLSYKFFTPEAQRLDNISIAEYLEKVPTTSLVRNLFRIAYTIEYGREPEEQSALNLLFLVGTETDELNLFGDSDERYQIAGGNNQIISKLAELLAGAIEIGTVLEALAILPDGRYRVSLRAGESTFDRIYERVVLTIPFSVLRQIQINVPLPPAKRQAINTLGYGTNSKFISGYRERIWRTRYGSTASIFTDLPLQNTWEATPFYPGPDGLVTNFVGGRQGLLLGSGTPLEQLQRIQPQYEQIFPGISSVLTGQAIRVFWPGERYSQGSYSCYLVGQWTKFYGVEGERVGNLFFAGEHCSLENQGYMEGGCETGEIAAAEILQDLGLGAEGAQLLLRMKNNRQYRRPPSRRLPQQRWQPTRHQIAV
ncbi:MAG: NAD(P)/FAD-dependent oxidoreductase [Oscillatoriaceae bacterium SKW80]|nr:NAD(P)/FAD-dependent oxidoreductase [Oscillatoriaceae bacterium SKYG93]MCX8121813.1 NAD(P)/FAD-dependent oxidoreductase [Oscillatoriaceae bacterium SKW80]MDW8454573.1 NAD(P)/FAD-dependent oxidoreductase [Oscillatoriaceae cyanobacterium SKYGB_i_bin93]HIK27387.1 NAD(P)/FAD-dependent oxidoreductase [Oscillatoriaceae cyanobacterium M7585_C2015_266]